MMKEKRLVFCTLFTSAYNVHLTKDVGMLPYLMYKKFGYDSTLVTFKNEESYDYLKKEVSGLNIRYIKKGKFPFAKSTISGCLFLLRESKKIDVLNLYHSKISTIIQGVVYKIFNPTGFLYLKLDTSLDYLNKENKRSLGVYLKSLFFNKIVNIISYEIKNVKDFFTEIYKIKDVKKLVYLPNGFLFSAQEKLLDFEDKENLIITVGRIGQAVKNNEFLLESLKNIDLKDWKVIFIGPIEKQFQKTIDGFYKENPALKEKVLFTGNIADKEKLYQFYNRAKIFCLTSRAEGFSIALVDALARGNFIISTNISSIHDITNEGNLGFIVKDAKQLSNKIEYLIKNEDFLKTKYFQSVLYAKNNFEWTTIIKNLQEAII